MKTLSLRVLERIADVPREKWDALLSPDDPYARPFLEWQWLALYEESGSVSPRNGWLPQHLTLWDGERLVAAAPAYVRGGSEGEYVYDFSWAHAAGQLGVDYYPKLLLAVPFTPATGSRFLVAAGEDRPALTKALAKAALELAEANGLSGVHVNFLTDEQAGWLADVGFHRRGTVQFHWKNAGYRDYQDYLARFTSKDRNQLKRERAQAAKDGLTIETVRGDALTPEAGKWASRFYGATIDKHQWGRRLVNEKFFVLAAEKFRHGVEVVLAKDATGVPVGGAFNVVGPRRLYGRLWGQHGEHRYLHFNVCFYHSIDEAIARGLEAFEPGAGGEHKVARGFEPTIVHSVHWIRDRRLAGPIYSFCERERKSLERQVAEAIEGSPLRKKIAPPAPKPRAPA